MTACLHPTSLDPAHADVGALEIWRPDDSARQCVRLEGRQDDAAVEQAGDVLSFVVDRLNRHHCDADSEEYLLLGRIGDMASAEAQAWEAWSALPEDVRRLGLRPHRIDGDVQTPSSEALDAYVQVLIEQAQQMADKAAKKREADWIHEQNEEDAAMRRASRTDAAIDAAKETT